MIHSSKPIHHIHKAYGIEPIVKKSDGNSEVKGSQRPEPSRDSLSISEEARQLQGFVKAIQEAPDLRTDKIGALQVAVQTGTYHVTGLQIAEQMLRRP
ncbi:negative regulator of flagellin synthesis, flgm, putative [Heliomicrobium modesticaldum Ice1]|uniref:Negative regulator of flagellin synthesis, flgm, putative n=1 Tax=Heliobacterium modesticaldum (strain ATCC 51547 / Ice1) TaxID=498761 RepID=B0TH48_HELMI|nr:flagellar biosynthesis anti-sigma factor FlgM [Heliomicrobium modesticaldum]ABZ83373.1 negative regulator of flagellin synthesis, flgm, putative [Heliomicrobium modesticaldum Ice1]